MVVAAKLLRPVLQEATTEARDATDRLVQAHRDGFQVPTREEVRHVDEPEPPLPPSLIDYLDQFDATGRAYYEPKARSLLENGMQEPFVILALDRLRAANGEALQ